MGSFTLGGAEAAGVTVQTGSLTTASGAGSTTTGSFILGDFNVSVFGTFTATVQLQKSFNGGSSWLSSINRHTGLVTSWTGGSIGTVVVSEPEPGTMYRLICTAYTSGTASTRVAAGFNKRAADDQRLT